MKLIKILSLTSSLLAVSCVLEAEKPYESFAIEQRPAGQFGEARNAVASRVAALNQILTQSSKDTHLPRQRQQEFQKFSEEIKPSDVKIGSDLNEINRQLEQVESARTMVYAKMDALHKELSKTSKGAQKQKIRQELKKFQKGSEQLDEKRRRLQAQKEEIISVQVRDNAPSVTIFPNTSALPSSGFDVAVDQGPFVVNDDPILMNDMVPPPPPPPRETSAVKALVSNGIPPILEQKTEATARSNGVPSMGGGSHLDAIKNGAFSLKKVFHPTPLQMQYWERNKSCWEAIRPTCLPGSSAANEDSLLAAIAARRGSIVETHQLRAHVPFVDLNGKSGTKFTFIKGHKISAEAFVYTNRSVKVEFYDGSVAYIAPDGQTLTGFDLPEGVEENLPMNVVPRSNSWSSDALLPKESSQSGFQSVSQQSMPRRNSLSMTSTPVSNESFLDLIRKGVTLRKVDRSGDVATKPRPNVIKNMSEVEMLTSANMNRALDDVELEECYEGFEVLKVGLIKADRIKYGMVIDLLDRLIQLVEKADNSLSGFENMRSELNTLVKKLHENRELLEGIPAFRENLEKVFGKNGKGGHLKDFQDYIDDKIEEEDDEW